MSTTAVIVLNTLVRDEFEREWHGFDEPLDFLQGDYTEENPPIEKLEAKVGDKTYSFDANKVREVIEHRREKIEYEVQDEADERSVLEDDEISFQWQYDSAKWWRSEEGIEAKVEERVEAYWQSKLEGLDEWLAVTDCRGHYMVETTKEFMTWMEMLMERQPALIPHIQEKIAEVREYWEKTVGETLRRMRGEDAAND
jgi:hypothetical protein